MIFNFWRMEVLFLEIDKSFRRDIFEKDIKSLVLEMLNVLKVREVRVRM